MILAPIFHTLTHLVTQQGTVETALANHPAMRLFQRASVSPPGPNGPWKTPSRDLDGSCLYKGSPGKSCTSPKRTWTAVTPDVIGQFSAICYYTVRDVGRMKTGSRPQGLIESDWVSLCLSVSVCLSFSLGRSVSLSLCLSVCVSLCLSVSLCLCVSVYLYLYLYLCLYIYIYICFSIYLR